jgi:REP-associated tyrosine transposase
LVTEAPEHLIQCLVYIDLNMVCAGVVRHPNQWPCGGYREIQNPKQRYGIIDYERLIELLRMKNLAGVQESCKGRVEEALRREEQCRQTKWTEHCGGK